MVTPNRYVTLLTFFSARPRAPHKVTSRLSFLLSLRLLRGIELAEVARAVLLEPRCKQDAEGRPPQRARLLHLHVDGLAEFVKVERAVAVLVDAADDGGAVLDGEVELHQRAQRDLEARIVAREVSNQPVRGRGSMKA